MTSPHSENLLPRHTSFGWLIAVLGGQLATELDGKLKTIGLNITLWPTLFALWEEEGLTQAELAARCQTAHYTTTRVLDSLEKLELVERRKHPTSRRAYQIFLTEKGRELEAEGTALAKECNRNFLSPLSEDESETLHALITKVVQARMS
ncbi:MarR family winged helix-turn-helix transcriptional regulator [Aliamphritea spongicola]|uniref:MarR family winged helix-turn-helix transcriptional regulator n=1 Tax=Aliamphritea spongicola TaxID=707589 RepID=UPI00196B934C|nr:MarR family transcriptional regulator [Aliamphritea spongicola]MBN3561588.1 MarR family transcriptional regulator [Aliamphritea spongicola]